MKYLAYGLLPAFAAALALGGCATLEHRPESASPDRAPKTAPAEPRTDTVRTADRADPAGASVKPAHEIRPVDHLLHLNLHLYGFSYHTDRQGVRRGGLDNELNLGLGINYVFRENARSVSFVEAGVYRDSGRNWARLAGAGYQFKLGERWRLGGALIGVHSPTYNNGKFFIAPLPILTYDFGTVKLNAIYAPRYKDYNQFAVFGFYLSLPLGK